MTTAQHINILSDLNNYTHGYDDEEIIFNVKKIELMIQKDKLIST